MPERVKASPSPVRFNPDGVRCLLINHLELLRTMREHDCFAKDADDKEMLDAAIRQTEIQMDSIVMAEEQSYLVDE